MVETSAGDLIFLRLGWRDDEVERIAREPLLIERLCGVKGIDMAESRYVVGVRVTGVNCELWELV